jgi:hypothetical protein
VDTYTPIPKTISPDTGGGTLDPVPAAILPVPQPLPTPAKGTAQLYVTGSITDEQGKPIASVLVTMTLLNGTVLSGPDETTTGHYDAWTDQDPNQVYLYFAADGFAVGEFLFSKLMQSPNIVLKAGNTNPATSASFPSWAILLVLTAVFIYSKKRKKVGAFDDKEILTIMLLIGGVLAFNVVKRILDSLGLTKDPTTNEQANPNSPWKPAYYHLYNTFTYSLTESQARAYATTIHDAFKVYQDDYNAVFSVFSQLQTKANVSYLADIFNQVYDEDLLSFLTDGGGIMPWDGLSHAHLQTILDLVDKLRTN